MNSVKSRVEEILPYDETSLPLSIEVVPSFRCIHDQNCFHDLVVQTEQGWSQTIPALLGTLPMVVHINSLLMLNRRSQVSLKSRPISHTGTLTTFSNS